MPELDLHAAAERMTRLLEGVPDDALKGPTPCEDLRLDALIDHIGGMPLAFTAAAKKDLGEVTTQPPEPREDQLEPGWRQRLAGELATLADAWDAPDAWDGMTQVAGLDLPGETAGRIVLDELVVHAWDIARSTGQRFECDDATIREVEATVQGFRGDNQGEMPGLFGPVVPVADDAPPLHQLLSLTGRDPGWAPPGS